MNVVVLRKFALLLGIGLLFVPVAPAVVFSGSSGTLSASADFTIVGGNLQVVLTNTSATPIASQADLLSAVFFNLTGVTLTPLSAVLNAGSTVYNAGTCSSGVGCSGPVVGGEFEYLAGIGAVSPNGANSGISNSGFGIFGDANFAGTNLDGPTSVDGFQYGLTSAGSVATSGNPAVQASPVIHNSVILTLSVASGVLSLTNLSNVAFQYGTALGTDACIGCLQSVPEPSKAFIPLAIGFATLLWWFRRKQVVA